MHNRWAALIITLFAATGFWMSLIVPPFETPDEPFHYAFARHIAAGNWLPVQQPDQEQPWSHEGSQAPLYYLLTGSLTASIDQSDYPALAVRNPRANIGNPLLPGNKNFMLYSGANPPLRGASLALHMGRWFSLLLAVITLWATWLTARLALPKQPRLQLTALIFAAAIPQFVFVSASFSNDNLVTTLGAVTLYVLARLVDQNGREDCPSFWQWVGLGLLLGLAALSKLSGLGLCLLVALAVWAMAAQKRDWTLPWRALLPVAIPFVLVAGWWYWRNQTLYGDWLGANFLLEINGQRTDDLTWSSLWDEFRGLRYSFWGLFGWFNVPLPLWTYTVFDGLSLVALTGLIGRLGIWGIGWVESKSRSESEEGGQPSVNSPVIMVLVAWAIIPFGLIVYWAQQATSSQGRLLFPSIGALIILLVWGFDFWWQFLPSRTEAGRAISRVAWALIPAFPLACTAYMLFILIPQSYTAPPPLDALPANVEPIIIRYGDSSLGQTEFTLLGLTVGTEVEPEEQPEDGSAKKRYRPGESVPVTLYLRAGEKPEGDHHIFIQLLDTKSEVMANLTTHPGWGRNPTTLWEPGEIYADSYMVRIDGPIGNQSPLLARLYVGVLDLATEQSGRQPLSAFNEAEGAIESMPATVTISPAESITAADIEGLEALNQPSTFGNAIDLIGKMVPAAFSASAESIDVMIFWESTAAVSVDYVAYVHLLNTSGERVGGFDQPPAGGRFPTNHWQKDDHILTEFTIALPPNLATGQYELWLGLYEEGSQGAARLPVTNAGGLETAHNQLLLGKVVVE